MIKESEQALAFRVVDTGPGIAPEEQDKIFSAFSQADRKFESEKVSGGTGLGLAIAAQLANALGGELLLEKSTAEGSTFLFTMPVPSDAEKLEEENSTEIPEGAERENSSRFRYTKALVADDNEINLQTLTALLNKFGIETLEARNGAEAISLFRDNEVDLVLMDIRMPGMSGVEAAVQIRDLPRGKETPVIAVTAFAMKGDKEKFLASGLDAYLSKPVLREDLVEVLGEFQSV